MLFPYTFTQKVNSDRLKEEILSSEGITKSLAHINSSENPVTVTIVFKEQLPPNQVEKLNNLLMGHDNSPAISVQQPIEIKDTKKTTDGITKVSIYEPEGSSATIVTHNFADKCSWYQHSLAVNADVLQAQPGSENKIFKGQKTHWIDLTHGRLYDEDNIMLESKNKWAIKIYVDNVLQVEGPETYTVDPVKGEVTFKHAQTGTVKADYYYANKSYFAVSPREGKKLSIKAAEVQFGIKSRIQSPFVFEVWTRGEVPYPVPGTQIVYKNAKDLISACNEGQGFIPQWGDLTEDVIVFPFDYARPKPMYYSQGVEIRVYCRDHQEIPGTYTTATFYVTIDSETSK